MSKPCFKCIEKLSKLKYYKLTTVYYSNNTGGITKIKFNALLKEKDPHISGHWKTR